MCLLLVAFREGDKTHRLVYKAMVRARRTEKKEVDRRIQPESYIPVSSSSQESITVVFPWLATVQCLRVQSNGV
jgi:hypothetical protein